jgi:response regulator RpfG family c-di-GMP phosphodiesterase
MTVDRVLFVDDEQHILNAAKRLFMSDTVDVLTASTSLEGMELMKRNTVAVIVSDNSMPGMNGIAFLEWTKTVSPDSVRILMTGYEDLHSAIESINRGEVFTFVTKPWDDTELSQIVLDSIDMYKIVSSIKSADEAKLLSLAQTIELKDPYTKGHCERVATYALMLADGMDLSDDMKKNIKYGSWLHDCGKIGIPEIILNKPTELDDEQFATIKKHSRWGADVAKTAQLPEPVVNIALYHHERFNGEGYPLGLKSTDIPLEARVVAIADAFDAMTSDRPYRKKLSKEEAIALITKSKSASFDPALVDIFISVLTDFVLNNEHGE